MFVSDSLIGDLVGLVITITTIFILYSKWRYQYWAKKNVPFLKPSLPHGNVASGLNGKEHLGFSIKQSYNEMKAKGWKFGGFFIFIWPNLMLLDLDLIKNVMTRDFQHFVDRPGYCNEKDDPLSAHLASLSGSRWKNLRAKLTPAFTSGKIRVMFQTLVDCEVNLRKKLEEESSKNKPSDIKEVLARFTTDVIGSCAFGLDCKTFEDENSPFRVYGKKSFDLSMSQKYKDIFAITCPNLARFLHVTITPKDVEDFYMKLVKDIVDYREKNNYRRSDFMQMLIDMKNNSFVDDEGKKRDELTLTFDELAAQAFLFFQGGFESSSALMSFTLYELGKHQGIQDKLRDEICTVLAKHDDNITYEAIQEMKYLSQVLDETLRMYPPVPFTIRRCEKDYQIPETDIVIQAGTFVTIPMMAIQHDPEYHPNPEKFDPDRFTEENKKSRHHYTFLPFGEGPRNCIGMRFGLIQVKVGLTAVLRNFQVTVNRKTKEPLKMKTFTPIFSVDGGIWLDVHQL